MVLEKQNQPPERDPITLDFEEYDGGEDYSLSDYRSASTNQSITDPLARSMLCDFGIDLEPAGNGGQFNIGDPQFLAMTGGVPRLEPVHGRPEEAQAGNDQPPITKDDKGNITDVRYPDGTSRHIDYDSAGRITHITLFDRDGKEVSRIDTSKEPNATYTMKPDGTLEKVHNKFTKLGETGIYDRTGRQIGSRYSEMREELFTESWRPDGVHSTKRTYPDGSTRELLARNGEPFQYTYTDKKGTHVWQREGNSNKWYQASDTAKKNPWVGTIEFAFDGRLIEKEDNGRITEVSRDGVRTDGSVETYRQELARLTDRTLTDAEKTQLKKELDAIEKRVKAGKLSAREASDSLAEARRLLINPSTAGVTPEQLSVLSRQIVNLTGLPNEIDQGPYNNCNMAAPEVRLGHRVPSRVAKVAADAALTGKYTATNGQTVDVSDSLQPANAVHLKVPPGENERSYAHQLFHLVSVNLCLADLNKQHGTQLAYVQRPATATDNGARVLDKSKNPPAEIYGIENGVPILAPKVIKDENGRPLLDDNMQPRMTRVMTEPGLTIQDSINVMEKITGKKEFGAAIGHYDAVGGPDNWILDYVGLASHVPRDSRIPFFKNEADLKKLLKEAKRDGKLPIILQTHTGGGFLAKQVEEASGKPLGGEGDSFGGGHVLCITDYHDLTGQATVDNTWGKSRDKMATLAEVVAISRQSADLQQKQIQHHKDVRAAYEAWCSYFGKTPDVDYPPKITGQIWLAKYKREQGR